MSSTSLSTNTDSIIEESNDVFAGIQSRRIHDEISQHRSGFPFERSAVPVPDQARFQVYVCSFAEWTKVCAKQGHKCSKKDLQSKPDSPQGPKANQATPVSYKVDCKWHVSFTNTVRKANGPGKKNQYDLTCPVKVTSSHCDHNHVCDKQSFNALVIYIRTYPLTLCYFFNLLEHFARVDGNLIRSVLSNCYPAAFKGSTMQISNLHTFVLSKLSKMAPETKKTTLLLWPNS